MCVIYSETFASLPALGKLVPGAHCKLKLVQFARWRHQVGGGVILLTLNEYIYIYVYE